MSDQPRHGREPGRVYTGTKVFAPGAKLHLGEIYGGMNERGHFIGKGRNGARWVNSAIGLDLLVNIRPQLIYSPRELRDLKRLEAYLTEDRDAASKRADQLRGTVEWLLEERRRAAEHTAVARVAVLPLRTGANSLATFVRRLMKPFRPRG